MTCNLAVLPIAARCRQHYPSGSEMHRRPRRDCEQGRVSVIPRCQVLELNHYRQIQQVAAMMPALWQTGMLPDVLYLADHCFL